MKTKNPTERERKKSWSFIDSSRGILNREKESKITTSSTTVNTEVEMVDNATEAEPDIKELLSSVIFRK